VKPCARRRCCSQRCRSPWGSIPLTQPVGGGETLVTVRGQIEGFAQDGGNIA
jgi:hypothetical protein